MCGWEGLAWPGLLALGSAAGGGPRAVCRVSPPPLGTEQSQPVAFPPSTEPAFVTVPQRGFGEPFVLNPGTWALLVEAEGVLLVRWG